MTQFVKERFSYFNGYLSYYIDYEHHPKFVAKFKYGNAFRGNITMAKFRNFLIKNFTVEEYFKKVENSTPYQVVVDRGIVKEESYVEESV